jgi:hypothetical protein
LKPLTARRAEAIARQLVSEGQAAKESVVQRESNWRTRA